MIDGRLGDSKGVGDNVSELRIDYGPGYRVYYTKVGIEIILLLVGGDKSTQASDIKTAKALAKAWRS
jgi:putative addiction module killer protein